MASLKAPVVIFFFLILIEKSERVSSAPVMTTTTSLDNGLTLTVRCDVSQSSTAQSIELGKGSPPDSSGRVPSSNTILAYIGTDNQIRNHVGQTIGIEGHLDSKANASFLSVSVHQAGCNYDGRLYCKVTSYRGGGVVYDYTDVTICAPPARIAVNTPDVSKPMRFVIRCDINRADETSVDSVQLIMLSSASSNALAVTVVDNGTSSTFPDGVVIRGHINTTDPYKSFLEADFTHGTCSDLGEYQCLVSYTNHTGGPNTRSASVISVSKGRTDNICDIKCFTATSSYIADTTTITMTCSPIMGCSPLDVTVRKQRNRQNRIMEHNGNCFLPCNVRQVISREFSVVSHSDEQLIYFVDMYSSNGRNVVGHNFTDRALTVTEIGQQQLQNQQGLTWNDATCNDAGQTYRCKMVYMDNLNHIKVYIADTKVPSCDSGALTTSRGRSLICRPDPAVVTSGLLSLEISTITKSRTLQTSSSARTVLAVLNPYLNNGNPVDESGGQVGVFQLSGRLDRSDPASSYLNLTSSHASGQGHSVATSCMVVYQTAGGGVKKAYADTTFGF